MATEDLKKLEVSFGDNKSVTVNLSQEELELWGDISDKERISKLLEQNDTAEVDKYNVNLVVAAKEIMKERGGLDAREVLQNISEKEGNSVKEVRFGNLRGTIINKISASQSLDRWKAMLTNNSARPLTPSETEFMMNLSGTTLPTGSDFKAARAEWIIKNAIAEREAQIEAAKAVTAELVSLKQNIARAQGLNLEAVEDETVALKSVKDGNLVNVQNDAQNLHDEANEIGDAVQQNLVTIYRNAYGKKTNDPLNELYTTTKIGVESIKVLKSHEEIIERINRILPEEQEVGLEVAEEIKKLDYKSRVSDFIASNLDGQHEEEQKETKVLTEDLKTTQDYIELKRELRAREVAELEFPEVLGVAEEELTNIGRLTSRQVALTNKINEYETFSTDEVAKLTKLESGAKELSQKIESDRYERTDISGEIDKLREKAGIAGLAAKIEEEISKNRKKNQSELIAVEAAREVIHTKYRSLDEKLREAKLAAEKDITDFNKFLNEIAGPVMHEGNRILTDDIRQGEDGKYTVVEGGKASRSISGNNTDILAAKSGILQENVQRFKDAVSIMDLEKAAKARDIGVGALLQEATEVHELLEGEENNQNALNRIKLEASAQVTALATHKPTDEVTANMAKKEALVDAIGIRLGEIEQISQSLEGDVALQAIATGDAYKHLSSQLYVPESSMPVSEVDKRSTLEQNRWNAETRIENLNSLSDEVEKARKDRLQQQEEITQKVDEFKANLAGKEQRGMLDAELGKLQEVMMQFSDAEFDKIPTIKIEQNQKIINDINARIQQIDARVAELDGTMGNSITETEEARAGFDSKLDGLKQPFESEGSAKEKLEAEKAEAERKNEALEALKTEVRQKHDALKTQIDEFKKAIASLEGFATDEASVELNNKRTQLEGMLNDLSMSSQLMQNIANAIDANNKIIENAVKGIEGIDGVYDKLKQDLQETLERVQDEKTDFDDKVDSLSDLPAAGEDEDLEGLKEKRSSLQGRIGGLDSLSGEISNTETQEKDTSQKLSDRIKEFKDEVGDSDTRVAELGGIHTQIDSTINDFPGENVDTKKIEENQKLEGVNAGIRGIGEQLQADLKASSQGVSELEVGIDNAIGTLGLDGNIVSPLSSAKEEFDMVFDSELGSKKAELLDRSNDLDGARQTLATQQGTLIQNLSSLSKLAEGFKELERDSEFAELASGIAQNTSSVNEALDGVDVERVQREVERVQGVMKLINNRIDEIVEQHEKVGQDLGDAIGEVEFTKNLLQEKAGEIKTPFDLDAEKISAISLVDLRDAQSDALGRIDDFNTLNGMVAEAKTSLPEEIGGDELSRRMEETKALLNGTASNEDERAANDNRNKGLDVRSAELTETLGFTDTLSGEISDRVSDEQALQGQVEARINELEGLHSGIEANLQQDLSKVYLAQSDVLTAFDDIPELGEIPKENDKDTPEVLKEKRDVLDKNRIATEERISALEALQAQIAERKEELSQDIDGRKYDDRINSLKSFLEDDENQALNSQHEELKNALDSLGVNTLAEITSEIEKSQRRIKEINVAVSELNTKGVQVSPEMSDMAVDAGTPEVSDMGIGTEAVAGVTMDTQTPPKGRGVQASEGMSMQTMPEGTGVQAQIGGVSTQTEMDIPEGFADTITNVTDVSQLNIKECTLVELEGIRDEVVEDIKSNKLDLKFRKVTDLVEQGAEHHYAIVHALSDDIENGLQDRSVVCFVNEEQVAKQCHIARSVAAYGKVLKEEIDKVLAVDLSDEQAVSNVLDNSKHLDDVMKSNIRTTTTTNEKYDNNLLRSIADKYVATQLVKLTSSLYDIGLEQSGARIERYTDDQGVRQVEAQVNIGSDEVLNLSVSKEPPMALRLSYNEKDELSIMNSVYQDGKDVAVSQEFIDALKEQNFSITDKNGQGFSLSGEELQKHFTANLETSLEVGTETSLTSFVSEENRFAIDTTKVHEIASENAPDIETIEANLSSVEVSEDERGMTEENIAGQVLEEGPESEASIVGDESNGVTLDDAKSAEEAEAESSNLTVSGTSTGISSPEEVELDLSTSDISMVNEEPNGIEVTEEVATQDIVDNDQDIGATDEEIESTTSDVNATIESLRKEKEEVSISKAFNEVDSGSESEDSDNSENVEDKVRVTSQQGTSQAASDKKGEQELSRLEAFGKRAFGEPGSKRRQALSATSMFISRMFVGGGLAAAGGLVAPVGLYFVGSAIAKPISRTIKNYKLSKLQEGEYFKLPGSMRNDSIIHPSYLSHNKNSIEGPKDNGKVFNIDKDEFYIRELRYRGSGYCEIYKKGNNREFAKVTGEYQKSILDKIQQKNLCAKPASLKHPKINRFKNAKARYTPEVENVVSTFVAGGVAGNAIMAIGGATSAVSIIGGTVVTMAAPITMGAKIENDNKKLAEAINNKTQIAIPTRKEIVQQQRGADAPSVNKDKQFEQRVFAKTEELREEEKRKYNITDQDIRLTSAIPGVQGKARASQKRKETSDVSEHVPGMQTPQTPELNLEAQSLAPKAVNQDVPQPSTSVKPVTGAPKSEVESEALSVSSLSSDSSINTQAMSDFEVKLPEALKQQLSSIMEALRKKNVSMQNIPEGKSVGINPPSTPSVTAGRGVGGMERVTQ